MSGDPEDPRLQPFIDLNEQHRAAGRVKRKTPWSTRVEMIREQFPSVDLPGQALVKDEKFVAGILQDIIKVGQLAPEGQRRTGPRPPLSSMTREEKAAAWRELLGLEYSDRNFAETFQLLVNDESLSHVARKCSISRSRVHRLLRAEEPPTVDDIRLIAEAYGKRPAYFLEYRMEYVLAAVASRLNEAPGIATTAYRRLVRQYQDAQV